MSSQSYIFNPTERTSAAAGDGFSAPRLTTTDRLALTLGVNGKGMMVYDTTLTTLYIWNGTAWVSFPASGYSQGTWLGSFVSAVGSLTEDPAIKTGYWSRIGNTVTISMKIRVQAIAGPSGLLQVITLPFPAVQETALSVTADLLTNPAKTSIMAYATGSNINLYHYENGLLNPLSQHVPAGSIFWVSGTYITT
jgi:hypothetical protein